MHARYASEHPAEKFEDCFKKPFHIAYGKGKKLAGELGEWLCFIIQDQQESICIAQLIDGVKILPGKNYTAESLEAACNEKAEELKLYAPEPKRPELDAALSMSVAEGQGVGRYIKGKVLTVAVWDKRKSRWSCGAFRGLLDGGASREREPDQR